MNIFDKSPILKVLEILGALPDMESSWWTDIIARGLEEATLELPVEDSSSSE